ncbi:UNVERIFIED_CONTAM: Mitochondrial-processing peptidase subunit alpha [Siphonaria sp. JEL0065]|nr:Mitochondrial-processing peptidase subunit alpha [Siphonaria sp. JEL0065]
MLRGFHRKLSSSSNVTKLANGVTVASSPSPGHFVSCGVLVNTGASRETTATRGSSHMLDRMAFKATASMPTNTLMHAIESIGGNMLAHSSREAIMYQSSVFPKHLGEALSILAAVVKEPLFLPEELKEVKEQVAYEVDAMQWNYPQLLPEKLHQLAFGNKLGATNERYSIQTVTHTNDIASLCTPTSTIGTPLFCDDPHYVSAQSSKTLKDFHKTWYTPDRIVVSGVGMAHQQLVELAEKHFGSMGIATPEIKAAQQKVLDTPVKYNGGIVLVDTTGQPISPNPDDRLLTHVHIGFEAPGMLDPDVYAMATLASLMGGGGSFSAGGPGKGMYTRLYTEVLNRYHWVENCNMLSYSYQPTSLFGISASIPPHPETHAHILPILLSHLHQTTNPTSISSISLSRAKNQLKSNLLMSLESRSVELEDIARQVTAQNGDRVSVIEMCRRVDSVTPEDIARVAQRVFMGLDCESPLQFSGDEGVMQHWKRTGDGGPTVLVHGPLFGAKDAMHGLDERVREWGLGGDLFLRSGMKSNVAGHGLGGGKGRGLGSRLFGRKFGN